MPQHRPRFIGEEIEVEMDAPAGGVYAPVRVAWRGQTLEVEAIEQVFHKAGLPRTARREGWWLKRRRTHWVVRLSDGHTYEIYLDRTGSRRRWVLYKQLE